MRQRRGLPMGFLQFHQQPQPRRIMNVSNPKMLLIEYEANNGLRHVYMDGRKLPPQGEPQPWWYGYSVGHWEGDMLIVETNNLRGAEDGPHDGCLMLTRISHTSAAAIRWRGHSCLLASRSILDRPYPRTRWPIG
jgi:hypothetical protein